MRNEHRQQDIRVNEVSTAASQESVRAATVLETAKMLGVSRWTVQRMIAAETLHSVKIGKSRRIPFSEIRRLLGQREVSTRRATT